MIKRTSQEIAWKELNKTLCSRQCFVIIQELMDRTSKTKYCSTYLTLIICATILDQRKITWFQKRTVLYLLHMKVCHTSTFITASKQFWFTMINLPKLFWSNYFFLLYTDYTLFCSNHPQCQPGYWPSNNLNPAISPISLGNKKELDKPPQKRQIVW